MKPRLDGGNGRGGSRVTRVSTDKRYYLSNPCLVSWARVEALNPLTQRVDLIHLISSKSLSFLLALQAASGLHFGAMQSLLPIWSRGGYGLDRTLNPLRADLFCVDLVSKRGGMYLATQSLAPLLLHQKF